MLSTRLVTKAVLNAQRKSISKKKKQKIIWFNPQFSQTVKSNITKLFFRLLHQIFPKSNSLYKNFNRNAIKVSYICMNNISQIYKAI